MKATIIAIRPPELLFDEPKFKATVYQAMEMTAQAIKVDYGVTTQTWKHQPHFIIERGVWEYTVFTTDTIYGYVSGGTRPHIIRPRRAKALRFRTGFRAKTRVGQIRSLKGRSFGPVRYEKNYVNHPGNAARDFPEVIGRKWDKEWPRQLDRALGAAGY